MASTLAPFATVGYLISAFCGIHPPSLCPCWISYFCLLSHPSSLPLPLISVFCAMYPASLCQCWIFHFCFLWRPSSLPLPLLDILFLSFVAPILPPSATVGYVVSVLCGIHPPSLCHCWMFGFCLLWHPSSLPLPLLDTLFLSCVAPSLLPSASVRYFISFFCGIHPRSVCHCCITYFYLLWHPPSLPLSLLDILFLVFVASILPPSATVG